MSKRRRLSSCAGALALLVATFTTPIGLMSIGSAPLQAVLLLGVAFVASGLFVWAWLGDRRRRQIQRTTMHRHPAAGRAAGRYLPLGQTTKPISRFGEAVRMYLDDPGGHGALTIDGPGAFYLRFALDPGDSTVLCARAVPISRLEPSQRPAEDAWLGLVALGWAAADRPGYREVDAGTVPREEFAAEWQLPIAIEEVDGFIRSTARIYGFDELLLRSRFDTGIAAPQTPESPGLPDASPGWDPYVILKRWDSLPAAKFLWMALFVVFILVGRDGAEDLFGLIPNLFVSGTAAALCFVFAIHLLLRYRRTSDPFSLTGWNWLRRREVTHYQAHVWWGVFGALAGLAGVFFLVQAVAHPGT